MATQSRLSIAADSVFWGFEGGAKLHASVAGSRIKHSSWLQRLGDLILRTHLVSIVACLGWYWRAEQCSQHTNNYISTFITLEVYYTPHNYLRVKFWIISKNSYESPPYNASDKTKHYTSKLQAIFGRVIGRGAACSMHQVMVPEWWSTCALQSSGKATANSNILVTDGWVI